MKKQLPVLATLLAAVRLCVDNIAYALKILTPWFILILLLPNLFFFASVQDPANIAIPDFAPWELVETVIYTVGWSSIAVLWHWRILRDASQNRTSVTFDIRVWLYLARGFLIIFLVACVSAIPMILAILIPHTFAFSLIDLMFIPAVIISFVGFARLSVALPAVALNVPSFGLRDAWTATSGNSIRLLIVTIASLAPSAVILILIDWIVGFTAFDETALYSFSPGPFLIKISQEAVAFATGLIGLTILTITYAFFAESKEAGTIQASS